MKQSEMYHEVSMVEFAENMLDAVSGHAALNGCDTTTSSDVLRELFESIADCYAWSAKHPNCVFNP